MIRVYYTTRRVYYLWQDEPRIGLVTIRKVALSAVSTARPPHVHQGVIFAQAGMTTSYSALMTASYRRVTVSSSNRVNPSSGHEVLAQVNADVEQRVGRGC